MEGTLAYAASTERLCNQTQQLANNYNHTESEADVRAYQGEGDKEKGKATLLFQKRPK